jgi:hypothetical protein
MCRYITESTNRHRKKPQLYTTSADMSKCMYLCEANGISAHIHDWVVSNLHGHFAMIFTAEKWAELIDWRAGYHGQHT